MRPCTKSIAYAYYVPFIDPICFGRFVRQRVRRIFRRKSCVTQNGFLAFYIIILLNIRKFKSKLFSRVLLPLIRALKYFYLIAVSIIAFAAAYCLHRSN